MSLMEIQNAMSNTRDQEEPAPADTGVNGTRTDEPNPH